MENTISENYLSSVVRQFKYYEALGEKAMIQIPDQALFYTPNQNTNSIAIIVKHLHGNMLSRWTDFLNSDGEKSWRNRDDEFEGDLTTRKEVMEKWNEGWKILFDAIEPLGGEDLGKIIYIRNEGHTVLEAINRQLSHYCYHVGQIVFAAKMFKESEWKSLSIPRKGSEKYNEQKFSKDPQRKHFTEDFGNSA